MARDERYRRPLPESPSYFTAAGRRLLVVDDDPVVREMLCRVLREAGYEAVPATGGADALRLLVDRGCAGVLLDLGLGDDSGWRVLKQLRSLVPDLPVIIVTALSHQHAAAAAAGASGCFEKPLDFPELLEAIATLFRPPRATSPLAPTPIAKLS